MVYHELTTLRRLILLGQLKLTSQNRPVLAWLIHEIPLRNIVESLIECGLYGLHFISGSVVMFIAIIRQLGNRDVLAGANSGADKAAQHVRNQVARMLIVNGTVFFLLHLPVSP